MPLKTLRTWFWSSWGPWRKLDRPSAICLPGSIRTTYSTGYNMSDWSWQCLMWSLKALVHPRERCSDHCSLPSTPPILQNTVNVTSRSSLKLSSQCYQTVQGCHCCVVILILVTDIVIVACFCCLAFLLQSCCIYYSCEMTICHLRDQQSSFHSNSVQYSILFLTPHPSPSPVLARSYLYN